MTRIFNGTVLHGMPEEILALAKLEEEFVTTRLQDISTGSSPCDNCGMCHNCEGINICLKDTSFDNRYVFD